MVLKVTGIRAKVPFRLDVQFSDGAHGTHDASGWVNERTELVVPLRERDYFARVDLANGVPTWPNHFDLAPEWLREEMAKRGELKQPGAKGQRR